MPASISVKDSLENPDWVADNYRFLRSCFTETFVDLDMAFTLTFGWKLKLHGVEWRETSDISNFLGKYHRSKIFDSIINKEKMTGMIRRFPVVEGIEPVFMYPKDTPATVPATVPAVATMPVPSKDVDVIDVVAKERHEGAATKLLDLVRSWTNNKSSKK